MECRILSWQRRSGRSRLHAPNPALKRTASPPLSSALSLHFERPVWSASSDRYGPWIQPVDAHRIHAPRNLPSTASISATRLPYQLIPIIGRIPTLQHLAKHPVGIVAALVGPLAVLVLLKELGPEPMLVLVAQRAAMSVAALAAVKVAGCTLPYSPLTGSMNSIR